MRNCLVCDDHAMMRSALAGAVAMVLPDAEIATAADFPAAWAAAALLPSLILCDLSMPGADPLAGISGVRAAAPDAPLLVVTGSEDDALLLALFDLGIAGFVPKSSSAEIIEMAIRLVLAGGRYVPDRVVALAQNRTLTVAAPPFRAADAGISRLTDRQIDVLKRLARGESNKEIARALALSPTTVKTHVAAIIAALDTTNRTEAAFRAREMGLI
jgi:two-component system, NarL family, nitrate/nitrite response regulator NarL